MPTLKDKIIKKLYEILENKPNGIRYADLIRKIIDFLHCAKCKLQFVFQYKLNGQSVGIKMLTESFFNSYYNRN